MAKEDPNRKMKVLCRITKDGQPYPQETRTMWGPGDEVNFEVTNADGEAKHTFSVPAWLLWYLLKAHAKEGNVWMESPETIAGTGTYHWIEEQHSIYLLGTSILRRTKGGAS